MLSATGKCHTCGNESWVDALKLTLSEQGGGVVVTPEVKHDVPQPATSGQFFYVPLSGERRISVTLSQWAEIRERL